MKTYLLIYLLIGLMIMQNSYCQQNLNNSDIEIIKQDIIGKWKSDNSNTQYSLTLILGIDNKGSINGSPITYEVDRHLITILEGNMTNTYNFFLDGNKLIINGGELNEAIQLTREESTAPNNAPSTNSLPNSSLIGTWTSERETIIINEKTVTYQGQSYNYVLKDNVIIVSTLNGIACFPFELKGNQLSFMTNNTTTVYYRASTNRESPSSPSIGSRMGKEIAGTWSHYSSTSTGTSYHSQLLVLKPDGTFTFSTEGSISAKGYDQYGNQTFSAGTASNGAENGTWSFDGTKIIFNGVPMFCQKTYSKDTHEPALNINGTIFVTTVLPTHGN